MASPLLVPVDSKLAAASRLVQANWKVCAAAAVGVGVGVLVLASFRKSPPPPRRRTSEPAVESLADATDAPKERVDSKAPDSLLDLHDLDTLPAARRKELAKEAKKRGNALFGDRNFDDAVRLYSQAILLHQEAVYYSNRAACFANLDQHDKVILDCTRALELSPEYSKALARRALAYEKLDLWRDALNDYTVICALESFSNQSNLNLMDRVLKRLAESQVADIVKNRVPSLPSKVFLGAYFDSFIHTQTSAERIISLPPQNVHDNMVIEAFTFVQKKEFLDAWSVIEKIHLDDLTKEFRVEALNLRGTFKYLMGDEAGGIADLDAVLTLSPNNVNAYIKKASYELEKENPEGALSAFDKAIEMEANDPDIYYQRAQLKYLTNDVASALEDFKRMGSFQEAEKIFLDLSSRMPESGEVWNYYGEIQLDAGKFNEAFVSFEKSCHLDATSPLPWINKSTVALSTGDVTSAEEFAQKALNLDSSNDLTLLQLGQIYMASGKFTEAADAYQKAAVNVRTEAELINIVSCREAALAQVYCSVNYPELAKKIKELGAQM